MAERRVPDQLRARVAERAGHRCEYCQSQARFSPDPLSVEHIRPRACGGSSDLDNLALSCQGCNNRKYVAVESVDPVTGLQVPLFHPRQHRWSDHFLWNETQTLVIGLTPTGRATVERLELNREGLRNLRAVLRDLGFHPLAPLSNLEDDTDAR